MGARPWQSTYCFVGAVADMIFRGARGTLGSPSAARQRDLDGLVCGICYEGCRGIAGRCRASRPGRGARS